MSLPALFDSLAAPIVAAPMFIVSSPELVIAQCTSGIVGSMPALNARPQAQLDEWITLIKSGLAAHDSANPEHPSAPFAINQIAHRSNDRLMEDTATIVRHRVPSGVPANFLAASIERAGLDPDNLVRDADKATNVSPSSDSHRTWRDIWGCGHGVGAVTDIVPAAERVRRLVNDYRAARTRFGIN